MNPFESLKGGYVDPTVLSYFSLVQKKDMNTRSKALARIVGDLEKLPVESVSQCLYDTMPILCKGAQEPVSTYVSEIFLHVLKKSENEIRLNGACDWIDMFLRSPTKAGYKVVKMLTKKKNLKVLLATYNKKTETGLYIKSKLIEISFEESADISVERVKNAKTKEELLLLSKLLSALKEKNMLTAEIVEAALSCVAETLEVAEKWKVFAVIGKRYAIENVVEDSKKIDESTFLSIMQSEDFRKMLVSYGPSCFVEKCPQLPGILFSVLLEVGADRKGVLKKLLQSNTSGFEHIKIEKEDFPYINTINCYNRVNEVLQKYPITDEKVYAGLSYKEQIIRADIIGSRIDEINREMISKLSIRFLKEENVFEEGVRVLPPSFFREEESLTAEEHIYVASHHPSLTTRKTIDVLFKYKLFIAKILSNLSPDLMAYVMEKIEKEPADVVQEVYELVKDKIEQKYALRLLGKIYTVASYTKDDFSKKFELTEDVEENYLIYLIRKEAVDEKSVYRYIVADANQNATGTQEITDTYIGLTEILEDKETKQAFSKYLFGSAYVKWKKILDVLSNKKLSCALKDILQVQTSLPLVEDVLALDCIQEEGVLGLVARAIVFQKSMQSGETPKTFVALVETIKNRRTTNDTTESIELEERIIEAYKNMLSDKEIDIDRLKSAENITLENLPVNSRKALAYMLLQIQKRVKCPLLFISLSEAQALHGRVLSLAVQLESFDSLESNHALDNIDFSLLSQESICSIEQHLMSLPEKAALWIKSDSVWKSYNPAYRYEMYKPILKSIGKHYASFVLNMYSVSKVEEDAIDSEIFYMLFDIPAIRDIKNMDSYEWRLFLTICSEIRSIEICTLISAMVRAECKWLTFLIFSESTALDLLGLFARNFPILLRIFYKSSRNVKRVQKYFISHVTPQLIREEASRPLQGVQIKLKTIAENHIMVVLYKIEESELEVNINFPMDYPLNTPEVKIIRCVGVKKQRLQRLLLRVQMLMAEHCRIGEALVLWKLALDKAVDQIEECAICFFMVDEVTKNFPDTSCSKCNNQFHGMCLNKWLRRSKNLCPICREEIRS